jgi:uncharacterized protein (TIGR02271 family)
MTMTTQVHSPRTVTAFFDNKDTASEAVEELVKAGFPRATVRLISGAGKPSSSGQPQAEKGFWEALKDFFLPDEDRYTYAEGLRRGGYLLTVTTNEPDYHRALNILDREGAVDIDQRAQAWRKEGWKDWSAESAGRMPATSSPTTAPSTGTTRAATSEREEVVPVIEEQLMVGKREIGHGRVRVRSYVVEQPISEQVTLKDEHVHVERHPVDRPLRPGERTLQERTIEAKESREEPVVSKQARVKEEVVVKKDAEQRTEKVSDKVRYTEVKVEDERGNAVQSGNRKAG